MGKRKWRKKTEAQDSMEMLATFGGIREVARIVQAGIVAWRIIQLMEAYNEPEMPKCPDERELREREKKTALRGIFEESHNLFLLEWECAKIEKLIAEK